MVLLPNLQSCFTNLYQLFQLHNSFLKKLIEFNQKLSEKFTHFEDEISPLLRLFLPTYYEFADQLNKTTIYLDKNTQKYEEINQILSKKLLGNDIKLFLNKPIQRLVQLNILIENLSKTIPEPFNIYTGNWHKIIQYTVGEIDAFKGHLEQNTMLKHLSKTCSFINAQSLNDEKLNPVRFPLINAQFTFDRQCWKKQFLILNYRGVSLFVKINSN